MRDDFVIYPLQQQIKESKPEFLDKLLKEFSCTKEPDVESFLQNYAIQYERIGLARTYLYILREGDLSHITAYFSIAITATSFEGISKNRKSRVLGFKPGRNTKDHFGGILIGQLARADRYCSSDINGNEMIDDAEDIIEQGRYYIGGKIVYLDCREPLVGFYQQNGYTLVTPVPYPNGYYKMFKILPPLTF
jgi:hypothetical protein